MTRSETVSLLRFKKTLETLTTVFLSVALAALATSLASDSIGDFKWCNPSLSFAAFFLLFRTKVFLDDNRHNVWRIDCPVLLSAQIVFSIASWFCCVLAAIFLKGHHISSAKAMIAAFAIFSLWLIIEALYDLLRKCCSENTQPTAITAEHAGRTCKDRFCMLLFNIGYIILLSCCVFLHATPCEWMVTFVYKFLIFMVALDFFCTGGLCASSRKTPPQQNPPSTQPHPATAATPTKGATT